MKVASFNVNSVRARLPIVVGWLEENRPDVLCVQETKVQDADFPGGAFDEIGYKYAFKGQKSYNGVAIFSKHEIENVRFGFDDEPEDGPRIMRAEINGVVVVNTYVPQGYMRGTEKFEYKLRWFERLRGYFEKNFDGGAAVIWVGDLNAAPLAIDVYDPVSLLGHVCYNPEVQAALEGVMEWGFVDVFRKHCKEGGHYSFWDYRMRNSYKVNAGWRLDHIMASEMMAEKSIRCYIDKGVRESERPSDHVPIVSEFEW